MKRVNKEQVPKVFKDRAKPVKSEVIERRHIRERLALKGQGSNILFKKPGPKDRPSFTSAEPL